MLLCQVTHTILTWPSALHDLFQEEIVRRVNHPYSVFQVAVGSIPRLFFRNVHARHQRHDLPYLERKIGWLR